MKFISIKTFFEFKFYFADAKTMLRNHIAGKFQYPLVVRQEKENLSAAVVILKPKSPSMFFSKSHVYMKSMFTICELVKLLIFNKFIED